jgi:ankyrin repeat protein
MLKIIRQGKNQSDANKISQYVASNLPKFLVSRVKHISEKEIYEGINVLPYLYNDDNTRSIPIIKYLIEGGADINATRPLSFDTILHDVAGLGNIDILKYLITQTKVDINIKGNYNSTPLHIAIEQFRIDNANYLIQRGADVNSKNSPGMTPLHVAVKNNYYPYLKNLIDNSADVEIKDKYGRTAVQYAAMHGYKKILKYLVKEAGSDISSEDNERFTPLHWAVFFRHYYVMKYILTSTRANVDAKDKKGWTPVLYAANMEEVEIVEFLVIYGNADITIKDNDGLTVYDVSEKKWKQQVYKWLQNYNSTNTKNPL